MSATPSSARPAAQRGAPALAGALLLGVALLAAAGTACARAPVAGEMAPALQAQLFDGRAFDIATQRGHVVLVNFWASWCVPCRHEMPVLDALAREYGARGVVVIGLSADDRHERAEAERIARGYGYALGWLGDAHVNGYGQPAALPVTYAIDADGRVAQVVRASGDDTAAVLHAAIEAALAGATPQQRSKP